MKGIVFTEFLELVNSKYGEELTDRIIEEAKLPSGAAYTAVGTYDHAEIMTLVQRLSDATGTPVQDLLRTYGEHLFTRYAVRYPQFFNGVKSSFEFLSLIQGHIHVEVKKLYPDAELPSIQCKPLPDNGLELFYRSTRPLAAFAEGLMHGAIAHFEESVVVTKIEASSDGTYAHFELRAS